jgi:hypothetical protein
MKKFIVQIAVFVCCSIILVQTIFWLQNRFIYEKADLKLSSDINYIVIGNSHAECAFNDSLISNFKNIASSGESYFYSYIKLKNVLGQNKQITKVFVEFTNLSIASTNDRWIWDKEYMNSRVASFSPFIEWEESSLLLRKNFVEFFNSQSVAMRANTDRILLGDFDYVEGLGGYSSLTKSAVDSLILAIEKPEKIAAKTQMPSIYGLAYLKEIVNLCKSNNVEVVFVRSPQHRLCNHLKNEKLLQKIKASQFKDIEFLDFNNFELANSEFADFEHLNYLGSTIFSKWFEINVILANIK